MKMADTGTRRRVKLYMLNEDRQWDDRGTGHVSSGYVERLKGMSLLVRSETDGSLLLESKIQPDTAYQKQQETLIVWSEAENYDLALSFQERAGCDEIWEKICQVQGKDPSVDITQDVVEESEDERFDDMPDAAPPIELPPCDLSKLEEISELFNNVLPSPIRREKLSVAIETENYIKKLIDLFHMCEDLDNIDGLHHLYDIFKSIFLLNKNALFEIMFADDIIFDVVGILEYDSSLSQPARHREYLQNTSRFKEVIPITNTELRNKIHQTYRVQYIQDVILPTPSVFEENILSTLSSFIFFNKVEIVTMIQEDEKFLNSLFTQLTDDETDDEKRRELVLFLKEFCTFSQTLQPQNRDSFFKTLSNLGILSAIEIILGLDDEQMKTAAIDIFSYIVEFSPSMVREFILLEGQSQDDEDLLINLVIEQMINDTDPELGGAMQLMAIIRLLIDPENMLATANKTEKTEFLSFFYKHSMHVLTAPLFANTTDNKPSKDDYQTAQLLSLIMELLSFCVEHHTYHIKNYIISKDLLRRVLVLLKSQHAFLALCALRFMRKIIGLKEEFYNRYITKGNLFQPVVDAFNANGDRYNLLNSAMIEMFEFVKMEDIRSLCTNIAENHIKDLENVNYVNTFKSLKHRYEQQQDRIREKSATESMPSILRNSRFRRDERALDEEEDMYFNQDDDLDDGESIVPMGDILKNKLDPDFDQISRFIENKRGEFALFHSHKVSKSNNINLTAKEQSELTKDCPIKLHNKTSAISINIKSSSPVSSPGSPKSPGSPTSPKSPGSPGRTSSGITSNTGISPSEEKSVVTRKPGLIGGLVDYPDEDSDEDEEEEEESEVTAPSSKRPRLAT
ncbi:serine/threonine-protein phosphatase 4 regulatory subunit 3A isoform X3 [Octopus bimaculoides]|uniref:serine/threonine-protein phosphatase 4 regulatory subunit 3A isoform X3 n=1 Tax=Octopus bimaculoides TaxID=37653 RepID=UPI0022E61247|nr:serine/threonine-protein phosphatase 4 regulatory subunit 3A isoform X3 [Octopus bimaculoides]